MKKCSYCRSEFNSNEGFGFYWCTEACWAWNLLMSSEDFRRARIPAREDWVRWHRWRYNSKGPVPKFEW